MIVSAYSWSVGDFCFALNKQLVTYFTPSPLNIPNIFFPPIAHADYCGQIDWFNRFDKLEIPGDSCPVNSAWLLKW